MKRIHFILLLLSITLSSTTHSIVIRYEKSRAEPKEREESFFIYPDYQPETPNTLDKQAIELAKNEAFAPVGMVQLIFSNKKKTDFIEVRCTGTLIDKRSVLTTADCIRPLTQGFDFFRERGETRDNSFTLGNDLYSHPETTAKIEGVAYYESYTKDTRDMEAQNLALLFLDTAMEDVEPAKLFDGNVDEIFDQKVVFVGFGFAGNPVDGIKPNIDYLKRACEQQVTGFKKSMYQTQFSNTDAYLSGMFTHGDQGGPAFFKNSRGEWQLVGVNALRIVPPTDKSKKSSKDARLVPYGTVGYSLAIPAYLDWIKEHQGKKNATRVSNLGELEESTWDFLPFWKKHQAPKNSLGYYFDVLFDQSGIVTISDYYSVDRLTLNHPGAQVFLPRVQMLAATPEKVDQHVKDLYSEGKFFEAVEYRRTILEHPDAEHAKRRSQLYATTAIIHDGALHIDGELWVERCEINGGVLRGVGELKNSTIPVINRGGTVSPGFNKQIGKLTIWGDYLQEKGGTLTIKVAKTEYIANKSIRYKVTHDSLKVFGEATLGGTLEIVETGLPLSVDTRLNILDVSQRVYGKFDKIKAPLHLKPIVHYGGHDITITFTAPDKVSLDNMENRDVTINHAEKLLVVDVPKLKSLALNGGIIIGGDKLVVQGDFSVIDGILAAGKIETTNEFVIDGEYRQTGGKLVIKVMNPLELQPTIGTMKPQTFHDSVMVTGSAHLGGHLDLSISPEAPVEHGESIVILRAQNITGEFTSVNEFPSLLKPYITYKPTEVVVTFLADPFSSVSEITDPDLKLLAKFLDETRERKQEGIFMSSIKTLERIPKIELPIRLKILQTLMRMSPSATLPVANSEGSETRQGNF